MSIKNYPVQGEPIEYTEEQLKSIQEKQILKKLEIMSDLDKIKVPIMCTVIMDPQAFEYRNMAFWDALKNKDDQVKLELTEYFNRRNQK